MFTDVLLAVVNMSPEILMNMVLTEKAEGWVRALILTTACRQSNCDSGQDQVCMIVPELNEYL